jgi:hypothetical protein
MQGNLGMYKRFSGQLGNQLFQMHFLMQLAKESQVKYFHRRSVCGNILKEGAATNTQLILSRFRNRNFSLKDIESVGFYRWHEECKSLLEANWNVFLEPGILGSVFFESCLVHPKSLLNLKKEIVSQIDSGKNDQAPRGAIHFRGNDFLQWNPNAILDLQYYMNSIDLIVSEGVDIKNISLSTDDPEHPISRAIYRRINRIPSSENQIGRDFAILAECDFLISSPSTFAFWAGVFGKEKKIIHSKKWLDYNVSREIKFWSDIRRSTSDIYSVYKEI